jgi:peptidoglycan biosynthesis protein MviN/MurJ (putative lipid II flippase)
MMLSPLLKSTYSSSLIFSGANTLCSVAFQFGILLKLGVGARSDLYFASIVIPLVAYSLTFGALNSVLVPMFVEAKARGSREEIVLFWNCLLVILVGVSASLILLYYPVRVAFPLLFRKLERIDLRQVTSVLIVYSLYQLFYVAVLAKNCFLFARGRPVFAQMGVFSGWVVSLCLLWRLHLAQNIAQIPLCLVAGNVVALLFPALGTNVFFYRRGSLKQHTILLFRRTWPVTAGCSVSWIEPVIDGVIASALKTGSLTIYYFFSRMMLYTVMSILSGYVQPVTKHLAELAVMESLGDLRRQTAKVVTNALLLGISIVSLGILGLLFLRSVGIPFLHPYVLMFSQNLPIFLLLLGYLFGALGYAGYSNSLYVLGRERIFMAVSFIMFPAGLIMKIAGAQMFGLNGLAAGTSAYWLGYSGILVFCFSLALKQRHAQTLSSDYSPAFQGQVIKS